MTFDRVQLQSQPLHWHKPCCDDGMTYIVAAALAISTAWAGTDPPSECDSKFMVHVPESTLVTHQARVQSLLNRFSRVTMEVALNNGMMLHITSKEGLRNLPMIHPSSLDRRMRILIRSKAETKGAEKETVEDWNQFDLRASGESGARAADLFVEIGDWIPLKSREMALHTLNTYVAMSMVPYFRHLVVHVPIFDDSTAKSAEERELKRQAYEEIADLQAAGIEDIEVTRALRLPQVRFIATMLPLRLDHVTIVRSANSRRGPSSFSAHDGFDIRLYYSAL